jgi:Fe-S-cluster containining protein
MVTIFHFFRGIYRCLRHRVLKRQVVVRGSCTLCGRCCKDIIIREGGAYLTSRKAFEKAKERHPGLSRFYISGRRGSLITLTCTLQSPEGLCTDHENRLELCRDYPHAGIYYSGLNLEKHCGYELVEEPSFAGILEAAMRKAGKSDDEDDADVDLKMEP